MYLCALSVRHVLRTLLHVSPQFQREMSTECLTQVQYMNPGMFYYVDIGTYCCFYYVVTCTYSLGSEFKYLGSVPKSYCSVMPYTKPNPKPTR